jgi:hypothetical protein
LSSPILIVCCEDAGIAADKDKAPERIAMAQARMLCLLSAIEPLTSHHHALSMPVHVDHRYEPA